METTADTLKWWGVIFLNSKSVLGLQCGLVYSLTTHGGYMHLTTATENVKEHPMNIYNNNNNNWRVIS